ncbi:MAG: YggS family pyridoxal phosphate-dependent enzyme [bacterium]
MDVTQRIEALPRRMEEVRERIGGAAEGAGRDPSRVRIVAVTKTFPLEMVEGAIASGLDEIGESRVQEGREKIEALGEGAATWHMIGHLQTNKVRWAVRLFDIIHSVDSPRLAEEVQNRAELEGIETFPVLVQVNTSGEESKYGVDPSRLRPLMEEMSRLDRVRVEGLMTMAPFDERESVVRPAFVRLRELFEQVGSWSLPGVEMTHLSMGMSNDFEWAVAEGATLVRLGSALFGPREE